MPCNKLRYVQEWLCTHAPCSSALSHSAAGAPRVTLVLLQVAAALLQRRIVRQVHVLGGAVRPKHVEVAGAHQAQLPDVESRGAACQRACATG